MHIVYPVQHNGLQGQLGYHVERKYKHPNPTHNIVNNVIF